MRSERKAFMADCIFCKIVKGKIPSDKVMEGKHFIAIRDINPQAPVHILLITREHFKNILEFPRSEGMFFEMLSMIEKVVKAEKIEKGFRVVINTGLEAGQSVDHFHIHILGGREMKWPPG